MLGRIFYWLIFILGTCSGSFLNCVIYRLEKKESFLGGRSYCPECKHKLEFKDLIPVLSFFSLKGKCRYCNERISWQYPLVELATGILFVLAFQLTVNSQQLTTFNLLNFCYISAIISFLVIIFVYDLKHFIIPDKVIYPAIVMSGIWHLVSSIFFGAYAKYEILSIIYSAVLASGFFLLIVLVSKGRWMGLGDVKLAFFMGTVLGGQATFVALFLAFLSGALIGTGLVIFGRKGLKDEIPFGPFLAIATLFALFYGSQAINWYLSFLM